LVFYLHLRIPLVIAQSIDSTIAISKKAENQVFSALATGNPNEYEKMIFLSYLIIFSFVLYVRRIHLKGKHIGPINPDAEDGYLASHSRDPKFALYYGFRQKSGIPFIIKEEKWYHTVLVKIGLASELKLSDPKTDKRFFILTDTPEHLAEIFRDDAFTNSLHDLFDLHIHTLYSTKNRIWIKVKRHFKQKTDHDYVLNLYNNRLQILKSIRNHFESLQSQFTGKKTVTSRHFAFIFLSLHAALFTLTLTGFFPTSFDTADIFDDAKLAAYTIIFGIFFAGIWFLCILFTFIRKPWFGWVLTDFLLFGLIGIIGTTGFMIREANIRLDSQPSRFVYRELLSKSCELECGINSRRSRSTTYKLSYKECENFNWTLMRYKEKDSKCKKAHHFKFYMEFRWSSDVSDYYGAQVSPKSYFSGCRGDYFSIPVYKGLLDIEWVDLEGIRGIITSKDISQCRILY